MWMVEQIDDDFSLVLQILKLRKIPNNYVILIAYAYVTWRNLPPEANQESWGLKFTTSFRLHTAPKHLPYVQFFNSFGSQTYCLAFHSVQHMKWMKNEWRILRALFTAEWPHNWLIQGQDSVRWMLIGPKRSWWADFKFSGETLTVRHCKRTGKFTTILSDVTNVEQMLQ